MRAAVGAIACALAGSVACGRVGFDPVGEAMVDAPASGGAQITCADVNLGFAMGPNVVTGSTGGRSNRTSSCDGMGADVRIGWFAPATGSYRIDLCGSEATFNTVLSVHDGTCTGKQLACDDNSCGLAMLQSSVTLELAAGQGVVIVVDGAVPLITGNYRLSITLRDALATPL